MNDLKTKSPKKNDRVLRELETTFDLLQATMPSIKSPEMEKSPIPSLNQPTPSRQNSASPYVSSSEDEVYFGPVTEKERYGNSARYCEIWTKTKDGSRRTLDGRINWRDRASLGPEDSIEEEKENEDEENCPPGISKDGEITTPLCKPSFSFMPSRLTPSTDENNKIKEDVDCLTENISKLTTTPDPSKALQEHKIVSSKIENDADEIISTALPTPSPRKQKMIALEESTMEKHCEERVFGLGSSERKYRSRSPLQRSIELETNHSQIDGNLKPEAHEIHMVEKVIDTNNENSKPPTPKSRTLYSKPIMANGDNQIMVDIATNGNLKDVHQQNMESEKWRRRSVKQPFKSEEPIDEKDESDSITPINDIFEPNNLKTLEKIDHEEIGEKYQPVDEIVQDIKDKSHSLFDFKEEVSDGEQLSIIDVNDDQMFDDTVFTDYDDLSISRMTQKMSKHWRKKLNKENIEAHINEIKQHDNLSLEELVNQETNKNKTNTSNVAPSSSTCNEAILAEKRTDKNDTNNVTLETSSREGKDVNVTRPRLLTTKAICASSGGKDVNVTRRRPNKDLSNTRLSSSDFIFDPPTAQCQTIVDETPASITSSVLENLSENNYSGKEKMFEAKSAENAEPSGELSKTKVLGSSQSPVKCGSNLDHDEFDLSFDTTREEMILYEKFGQDYDEIVEKMTREEKISLKQEISKATPKDANELLRAKEPTNVDGKVDVNTSVSKVDKDDLHTTDSQGDSEPFIFSNSSQSSGITTVTSDSFAIIAHSIPSKTNSYLRDIKKGNVEMNTFDPVNDYVVDTILESVKNDFTKAKECDDHFDERTGINVSASLESLGEEIKITAEKNRCLQDLERSDHSVKSNVSMQSSQNENDLVNSSCSSSLLERIAKAKSLLPKSQEVLKAVDQNTATKKVYTPNSVPSKAKNIFTPVLPDFKFKTPNSTHGSGSMPRSGGHCSEAQNGRKLFSSNGKISIPSYQRQTASSTLEKSPTKSIKNQSTPKSGNIFSSPFDYVPRKGITSSTVDMKKIVSPVAQYINTNPTASIKCIRPKASKFLDSEIKEALHNPSDSSPSNVQSCASKNAKKYYPPIPAAEYVSSKFSVLTPVAPDNEPKELPKAFGVVNKVQATIVKHVGRTKVASNLGPEELLKATEKMTNLSPNAVPIGTPTLQPRNSMLMSRESAIGGNLIDQSTMEMSLQERKEIIKPTSGTLDRHF